MGRKKLTEEEKEERVQKKDEIKNNEKALKMKYTKKFNKNLYTYLQYWVKQKDKNGKKHTKVDMYKELGIGKTTFANYVSKDSIANLPKYEWLFSIKEYLDVPFAYLFGESKSLTVNDIDVSIKYGLTDKSLNILEKYQNKLDNFDNVCFLYVINSLIENTELIQKLGEMLIDKLSHKISYETQKLDGYNDIKYTRFYDIELFTIFNIIDGYFETALKETNIPQELIEMANKQATMRNDRLKIYDKSLNEEK